MVYAGGSTPTGIAVDGVGNVYNADSGVNYLTQVQRNSLAENFQSNYSLVLNAELSNVGSQSAAAQSSANGVNAGAFNLTGGSYACAFTNNLLNAMSAGQSCSLVAQFPAIGSTADVDTIAFTPATPSTASVGSLALSGVADQKGYTTLTAIGTASTTLPVFVASGTELSFPLTVTANSSSTDNSVTNNTVGPTTANYVLVSVDGGANTSYNFTSNNGLVASLTLNLAGLTAGSHSFTVSFPQQASFLASSASSGSFTIAPAGTAISWTPATTTQQVSAAIGNGVLNATVTPAVAGYFAYALGAAPSCTATTTTTSTPVDASTYLAVGGPYTIYATFCPTDTTDYSLSNSSINYSVVQATTTAAVGATTMVVAPSGANYTNLTAALQALPVTGGAIYIAPGTYTGQNAISYPNVQLRGLGGDSTQVILSGENGAWPTGQFTSSTVPAGFSFGPAGKGGDEGAATLDVSKNGYMGLTAATSGTTPNNFYAEYLTLQNTYNTDPTTTSTVFAGSNGSSTCTLGGPTQTLQYLYNNNQQCGSQALALFLNSDGAVLNNVNLLSQQDTLYASSIGCGTYCTVAREYMWKGLITGNVDYTFGDAALVFDHTNFFTTWHGLTASAGQETITAQNKRYPTGTTNGVPNSTLATSTDYLSGFVCNGCTLMSQSTGMTKLYYGRPWDISTSSYPSSYSTWIMLNTNVDQVNAAGWIGWDGVSQDLNTSTYGEFNTMAYTDPAVGTNGYPAALFNATPSVLYATNVGNATTASLLPTGLNAGSGAALGSRESYALALNAATAAPWYPVNFLSTTVPATKLASGQSANWNPVAALAAQVNNFVPVASVGAIAYGGSVTILGRPQTPGAGVIPTGNFAFYDSLNSNQVCTSVAGNCTLLSSGPLDASGEAYLTTNTLASGTHYITMMYSGDGSNFAGSTSSTYSIYVLNPGQLATNTTLNVANTSSTIGTPISGSITVAPATATGAVTLYLDGMLATTCTLTNGNCSWSIAALTAGAHTMYATYPGNTAYGHSVSTSVSLYAVAPVATGDTRTVTEPSFPTVCSQLTAALTTDPATIDLDPSVDATTTNIDGARIQAALNSCSATATTQSTQLSVELSMDSSATYNAFLSGPLSMPSNVTLLVDPNVTLYFSRNVQDYDKVAGIHTCGTINNNSATGSCWALIDIPRGSTNVGIMGYGKLNGRGGDALINAFTTSGFAMPSSNTWWNLATQANGEGGQQNPRFIQAESGSSNVTLYKITILNSPMFHVAVSTVNGFTAWGIKIVTPTAARNTDGIDPGGTTNATIAYNWISDGDDNVAVGAPSAPAANISVINNHFFAGHGESIGSYTGGGISNILYDNNMAVGNAFAGHGSTVDANGLFSASGVSDTNSTAVRIKTANDRGNLVTGIQYSNSCFLDHKADVQFTPYYSAGDSTTSIPNFTGILMQNLVFLNDASSSGTVELTGEYNTNNGSPITNPLTITMDNVTYPAALSSLVNSTAPVESSSVWGNGNYSGGTGQYSNLTIGPGNVSSNFLTAYNTLVATPANADTLTNNVSLTALNPPACVFTFLAPELTGPNNVAQTVPYATNANIDVILTPAVGGAAFPTGTVTVTDTTTANTFTSTLSGANDTLVVTIPASDLTLGAHTFTATYLGDSNYTIPASYQTFGKYQITVVQATPTITWTPSPTTITYGTTLNGLLNATASVPGGFTFTATPTAGGTAVTVTNSTVLTAGSYSIAASFAPTDNTDYTNASSSFTLTVNQATPALAWAAPPAITYNTNLTAVLNPTATFNSATVAGGFTYTAVPTTGGTAVAVTGSTVLTAGSWNLVATFTPSDPADYVSAGTTSATLTVNQATPALAWATPAAITYNTNLTAVLNPTATFNSATVAGGFTYTAVPTTGGTAVTVTSSTVLTAGSWNLIATFTPSDSTDYVAAGTTSVTLTVNKATPALAWATPAAIPYGTTLASSLNPTHTFNSATVAGGFTYTAVPTTGGTAVTVTSNTVLTAGNWNLIATFTPSDLTDYVSGGTTSASLAVGLIQPVATVTTPVATVVLQNPITFTANVKSTISTPTGSVNFLDGTTVLATVPLTAGQATYTTSSLALGSHTITVAYLGDSNFQAVNSTQLPVSVITISIGTIGSGGDLTGSGSGNLQTIQPGGRASFMLPILPNSGNSFPIQVTLSVSGLPTGATATVTPTIWAAQTNGTSWILPTNTALSGPTQIDITVPQTIANNKPVEHPWLAHAAPVAFALLLLPFAGRMRKSSKRFARLLTVLLMLTAGAAVAAGFTGCGGAGYFTQPTKTYTITVTTTAGNLTLPTNLNLTVE